MLANFDTVHNKYTIFGVIRLNLQQLLIQLRGEESLRLAAKRIGITHSYYHKIELGYDHYRNIPVSPSADTLAKIATAFKVDYMDLVKAAGYENDPHYNPDLLLPFQESPELQEWYTKLAQEDIQIVKQLHTTWKSLKGCDTDVL